MSAAVGAMRLSPPATARPATAGSASPSLVPDAEPLTVGGIDDALGLLYMAIAEQRTAGTESGKTRVLSAEKVQQRKLDDEMAAEKREQENEAHHGRGFFSSIGHLVGDVTHDVTHGHVVQAAKDVVDDVKEAADSPAFWNDLEQGALVVAKVAAVAGSAVVTAASFGTGAATIALAALALSVGGEVVSDTNCFGKYSQGIGVALEVAGAATGFTGGLVSTAATTASKLGLGIGAALTGFGGEADLVAGGAHVENQGFAANVEDAIADGQKAVSQNAEIEQTIGWVIDDLKASDKSHQRAEQSIQGAIETHDQSTAVATASISVKG